MIPARSRHEERITKEPETGYDKLPKVALVARIHRPPQQSGFGFKQALAYAARPASKQRS